MAVVYYEGHFLPEMEARLPISDRGFQHGDGAYATLQVREGIPLFFEDHYEQLKTQCKAFHLLIPSFDEETILELIKHNHASEGIWRLKIFVTGGDGIENRLPERTGRLLIVLKPFTPPPVKPLKMDVFPIPYWSCHASFKSLAHLNRFYVMEEAHKQGLDDCITITETGHILEASFGNLFWVEGQTLFTPDPSLPLYFGVTIRKVLDLAQELGFKITYVCSSLADIPTNASLFRTNTMHGVRQITQLGERLPPLNSTLQTLFVHGYEKLVEKYVQQKITRYEVTG